MWLCMLYDKISGRSLMNRSLSTFTALSVSAEKLMCGADVEEFRRRVAEAREFEVTGQCGRMVEYSSRRLGHCIGEIYLRTLPTKNGRWSIESPFDWPISIFSPVWLSAMWSGRIIPLA